MSEWQPISTAPEGESVLVYMKLIDAVDMAHKADTGRWISNGGTIWPPNVITHWMPLPPPPSSHQEQK